MPSRQENVSFEEALADLKRELSSRDLDQRDRAAAEVADLLELHFRPIEPVNFPDYYAEVVRAALLTRPLRPHEERDLISSIEEAFLVSQHKPPDAAVLLFVLSKAKPWVVIDFFVELLTEHRESLSENEIHQIVHALDRFLLLDREHPEFEKLMGELRRPGVQLALTSVGRIAPSHVNSCMPEDAGRVERRLEE